METTNELKARIIRITTSVHPLTDHNKLIVNAACKKLFDLTGEVFSQGKFVATR